MDIISITVSNNNNINLPAHEGDVGHDLKAASGPIFCGKPIDEGSEMFSLLRYIEYETNVALSPPEGVYTLVYPRSSVSSNTNLLLANSVGVIDTGYRNTIKLRFKYLPQPEDYELIDGKIFIRVNRDRIYKKGDRIGQAVFAKSLPIGIRISDSSAQDTSRGHAGFGSTGL